MTKPLIIYHAHCPDGFTAAWVAARALGDVELYPGEYGKPPPYELANDRQVFIVDFSYPREQLLKLCQHADRLQVLDHHKTAQADLEGLPYALFDMNRSGAGMTWDFFHEGVMRPWIVDYVEDRDLWRFKLPNSEEISLFIRTASHTLAVWDGMAHMPLDVVIDMAAGCKRYLDHYVEDALRQAYTIELGSFGLVTCVNLAYTGVSDVLGAALERFELEMAIGWRVDADGAFSCSIRSRAPRDCSAVAKSFGGGGHAQASGFKLHPDKNPAAIQLLRPLGKPAAR